MRAERAEGSGVEGTGVGRVEGAVTFWAPVWLKCEAGLAPDRRWLYLCLVEVSVIGGVQVDAEEVDAVEELSLYDCDGCLV